MQPSQPRRKVRDFKTHFFTRAGVVKAANGVSLDIMPQML